MFFNYIIQKKLMLFYFFNILLIYHNLHMVNFMENYFFNILL